MIDSFALLLSHGLIALAVWRLLSRPDLDEDSSSPAAARWGRGAAPAPGEDPPGA